MRRFDKKLHIEKANKLFEQRTLNEDRDYNDVFGRLGDAMKPEAKPQSENPYDVEIANLRAEMKENGVGSNPSGVIAYLEAKLVSERLKNKKSLGETPMNEDNYEMQGQEDFYSQMNQNEKQDGGEEINKNNWSGESTKVKINEKAHTVEVPNVGTFRLEFGGPEDFIKVYLSEEGYGEDEEDIKGMKYDDGTYSFGNYDMSITREHKNPYIALAQLAFNLY